jgi:hypothetical protein
MQIIENRHLMKGGDLFFSVHHKTRHAPQPGQRRGAPSPLARDDQVPTASGGDDS